MGEDSNPLANNFKILHGPSILVLREVRAQLQRAKAHPSHEVSALRFHLTGRTKNRPFWFEVRVKSIRVSPARDEYHILGTSLDGRAVQVRFWLYETSDKDYGVVIVDRKR